MLPSKSAFLFTLLTKGIFQFRSSNLHIFTTSQVKPTTPFLLLLTGANGLAANLVARGPCPLNVMQLVPQACDLVEYGELLSAKVKAADALMPPAYLGRRFGPNID